MGYHLVARADSPLLRLNLLQRTSGYPRQRTAFRLIGTNNIGKQEVTNDNGLLFLRILDMSDISLMTRNVVLGQFIYLGKKKSQKQ